MQHKPNMTDINGDKTIDVLINEYRVMRGEIGLYQQQQNQAINFSIIAFTGVLTVVFRDIVSSIGRDIAAVALLVLPIFILVAGLLYVDRTMRIDRIGRYIHNVLRVQLIDLCGHDVLLWESCKRVLIEEASGLRKIILWMLERVRLLMFALLFLIPYCMHVVIYGWPMIAWSGMAGAIWYLFCLDLVVFFAFVVIAWKFQETRGADSDASLKAKVLRKSAMQRGLKA